MGLEAHCGADVRHIAIISLPLAGHLDPMRALAGELESRGHKLTLVGPPGMDGAIEGVDFHALEDAEYPAGRLSEFLTFLPSVRGLRGIRRVIDEVAALSALYVRQLPSALEDIGADLVLHDQLEPAAGVVAQGMGLAQASLACALPMNREAHLPPPFLGWRYRDSAYGAWLAQGGHRVVDRMMAPQNAVVAEAARQFGLQPGQTGSALADWTAPTCDLGQCIPGLDYPRENGPHEVGPLRSQAPLSALPLERDGRDLVFCSLGSLMGGRADIFRRVARAAHELDVQLLVAHGGRLSETEVAELEALPGRPVLRDFVHQPSVLSEARAAVVHGGFNTVLDAAAAGVPTVLMPLAFEQHAIAERVRRAGAGVVVKAKGDLRSALDNVLNDRVLRRGALELAGSAAAAGGVVEAAKLVEATQGRSLGKCVQDRDVREPARQTTRTAVRPLLRLPLLRRLART